MALFRKSWILGFFTGLIGAFFLGCSTQETIVMKPATVIQRDVFVCKGLSEDNRWVGITDQFLPEKDSKIVVVAFLDQFDVDKTLNFELTNPMENIAASEVLFRPKKNPIGIYFSMSRLMSLGGEGEWKATVFADGEPIGESKFHIGEKTEEDKDQEGPRYFVVGADTLEESPESSDQELSDSDRFSSYIQEATPNLTIPIPEEPLPSSDADSVYP
ncbi:MAG: hypothetical protein JXR73_14585 [Candidatus Omnitrophica bacterium]|nr:hypothetical protein [Candidatus Omnitrophota bacterium]